MNDIRTDDFKIIRRLAGEIVHLNHITRIRRLGGLTNRTYYAAGEGEREYVFRIPGEGTEQIINRKNEKVSMELAGSCGIDAELIYFDTETGIKISYYITDAKTMNIDCMKQLENLRLAAEVLRTLHHSGADTKVPFEVFDMADQYESFLFNNQVKLFKNYREIQEQVRLLREQTEKNGKLRVPCHNDPLCENWVRSGERIYLIDWEYAGMNDPMWDLAAVSIEARLDEQEEEFLLESYADGIVSPDIRIRFAANKVFLDYLWSLWGKTRVPYEGKVMEEYAETRYQRLCNNLEKARRICN